MSPAFPWDDALAIGLGVLRWRPRDFWAATPREFLSALGRGARPEPLTLAQVYGLDVSAVARRLRLRGPRRDAPVALAEAELVRLSEEAEILRRVRAEESSLPRSVELGLTDSESPDYRRASAAAVRPAGARRRETRVEAAIVTRRETGDALAEHLLDRTIAARDSAVLTLSPRRLELEPGDLLAIPSDTHGTSSPRPTTPASPPRTPPATGACATISAPTARPWSRVEVSPPSPGGPAP